ncbi:hypothetical protein ABZ712_18065 [Streptomyces sp. NPDC006906]|uniref:hypothetical protein n=1 Tax=unclassified Streptomyces TaxID=2593676 RepID=UPI0033D876FC
MLREAARIRAGCTAAVLAGVLAGCSSSGAAKDADAPSAGPTTPTTVGAPPDASGTPFDVAAGSLPRNAAEALQLARAVTYGPDDWGRGVVAQRPSESEPDTVALLDGACRWTRVPLPRGTLASLSRYSELSAADGRGSVRMTAVVTVHATEAGADRQLNIALEEVLRCPEQLLRDGERVVDLVSSASARGEGQTYADDSVYERGRYLREDEPHKDGAGQPYEWTMDRLGTIVVSVSVKGSEGYAADDLRALATRGTSGMRTRVADLLGEGR